MRHLGRRGLRGFSLPELTVVLALGVLLVFVLQQALVSQRRFHQAQQEAVRRHETVRVSLAVITSALREASLSRGDAVVLSPGSVRIRMPLGYGFVCGSDGTGRRVGLAWFHGRWAAGAGDSVLVMGPGGWAVEAISAIEGPGPQVACVPEAGAMVRLARPVAGLAPGYPARAFRSQILEVQSADGERWLARRDGAGSDLLVGPLDADLGFRAWYVDEIGAETSVLAEAVRLGVVVVTGSSTAWPGGGSRRDTVQFSIGGRDR